jgi:hypothetical protein
MIFNSSANRGRQTNQTEQIMTQVSQNTNTVKLDRNARRRLARALAKANGAQSIETIVQAVEGPQQEVEEKKETKTEVVEAKEETTSDRGKTTKIIMEMMQSEEGTTRQAIIERLQTEFPGKELSAIKNTVGALMHVIPVRMNWVVEKTQIDPADKRKINFKVTGVKAAEQPAEEAASETAEAA